MVHAMSADESQFQRDVRPLGWLIPCIGSIAIVTGIATGLSSYLSLANLAFLFLLPVIFVAGRHGLIHGLITAAASTLAFNFFLVPPLHTLQITDADNLATLAILFAVAFAASHFAGQLQSQAHLARRKAAESEALADLSTTLGQQTSEADMHQCLAKALAREAGCLVSVDPADEALQDLEKSSPIDLSAAQWALAHGDAAGRGTLTLSSADRLFLATGGDAGRDLLVQFWRPDTLPPVPASRLAFVRAMARCCGEAIARLAVAEAQRALQLRTEQDAMRDALLASFGHDTRTPLTTIRSGLAALKGDPSNLAALDAAQEGAERLEWLFSNLVDLARIRAGAITLRLEAVDLTDAIASALDALKRQTAQRVLALEIPQTLPLVRSDERLLHHIIVNLVDNACKFSPVGGDVQIVIEHKVDGLSLIVLDSGPGLESGQIADLFQPFSRGQNGLSAPGTGLGLAIVAGYAKALGLVVTAGNRNDRAGAEFRLFFPASGHASQIAET
ncbi:MAG: DUF4118 domain-containing protein [Pseudorhodobacter sp.]|nr:MAG: DUF4118 domain-containing protein [Pseudorhodobacter sp.]